MIPIRLRALLLRTLLRHCAATDLATLHRRADQLATVWWWLSPKERSVTARNLHLCFPQLASEARDQLHRASLRHTCRSVLELGPLWHADRASILALIQHIEGEAAWQQARQQHKGAALLLTPHFGAWELAGLYASLRAPMTILYRPGRLGLAPLMQRARARFGAQVYPAHAGGIRALTRALHKGQVCGLLPDQNPSDGHGVFAEFFGQPTLCMTLAARLALRHGLQPWLLSAERLPNAVGFRLQFEAVDLCDNAAEQTQAIYRGIEGIVRRCPEQYLWAYRHFRHRPSGFTPVY